MLLVILLIFLCDADANSNQNVDLFEKFEKRVKRDDIGNFDYVTLNGTAYLGEPFVLSCLPPYPAPTYPAPKQLQWFKDGFPINPETDSVYRIITPTALKITKIDNPHFGSYSCEAELQDGRTLSASIKIRKGSNSATCRIVWSHVPEEVWLTEKKGYSTIKCTTYTYGAKITWTKNSVPLESSRTVRILSSGHLSVQNPLIIDEGIYTCTAQLSQDLKCTRSVSAYLKVKPLNEDGQVCNARFEALSGVIHSPGYPSDYPDSLDCTYQIILPVGKMIYLNFVDLSLEFDDNCLLDYVEVCDGDACRDNNVLGRFCKDSGEVSVQSSANSLTIRFHSDYLVGYSGFNAVYSSKGFVNKPGQSGACGWNQGENNGTITSPINPELLDESYSCKIDLRAPEDHEIVFFIEKMQLSCERNPIMLFESHINKPVTLCGKDKTNPIRFENVRLEFNPNNVPGYFKAGYYFIKTKGENPTELEENRSQFKTIPADIYLNEGGEHTLSCQPKDINAVIRWYKEDVLLLDTSDPDWVSPLEEVSLVQSNSLHLKNMKPFLVGIYTCQAISSSGLAQAKSVVGLKEFSSSETCNLLSEDASREVSWAQGTEDAVLTCSGSNVVSVSWTFNGKPLLFLKTRLTLQEKGQKLTFSTVRMKDSGIYNCVAYGVNCKQLSSINVVVSSQVCGVPKERPYTVKPMKTETRIISGRESKKGSYPWQAAIFHLTNERVICGGALINQHWVLSAAHCFRESKETYQVFLGKHNILQNEPGQKVLEILEIYNHQKYGQPKHDNDISLLKLGRDVIYSDVIRPICLSSGAFKLPGRSGVVAGWGALQYKGAYPSVLQEITVPIQSATLCESSLANITEVTPNMFCAGHKEEVVGGNGKKDACEGDSGSPFVIEKDDKWYVVGIVSFGSDCGRPGTYGFYTNVQKYHKWINKILYSN